ncbi:CpsD/CapB family tyrosine-protein kinase [bacterium]|nr:CpsD/CapB family tyrosine-protein kinase [bacterium]
MSKIFDALRKAEKGGRGKGGLGIKVSKYLKKPLSAKEDVFLQGLDEDFRRSLLTLRNSIDSEMRDKGTRVIMFTSALPGEGKSTIAVFLARMMAVNEMEKIAIVDCAVRNPQIHQFFGINNQKGIIDYLSGEASFSDTIHTIDGGMLDVVTVGVARDANVVQSLFRSDRMNAYVSEIAENYDYVLVDTSAILNAPETPILSSQMDGIVLVVQAGKTKREVIRRAVLDTNKQGGIFIGSVLNRKKYYIPEFIYKRV